MRNIRNSYSREENTKKETIRYQKMSPEKLIARYICLAEKASDAAKGFEALHFSGDHVAAEYGYNAKPAYILKAIKTINSTPRCGWNYWITKEADQNGYPSVLVYFEYKDECNRFQISFHTPYGLADDFIPLIGKGRKTRWTKQIGGSVRSCKRLIRIFGL